MFCDKNCVNKKVESEKHTTNRTCHKPSAIENFYGSAFSSSFIDNFKYSYYNGFFVQRRLLFFYYYCAQLFSD